MTLHALLWDVDGTLAETEAHGHRVAFNEAFAARGLDWHWDEARYAKLLAVPGGRERLIADMDHRDDAPAGSRQREALADELHALKNCRYAALVKSSRLPLRAGVAELLRDCREQGMRMAITSVTSRSNLAALLEVNLGAAWERYFAAVICGEDVDRKKPDPQVFELALSKLSLQPSQALAIEDSPAGLAAARAAGVPVVVTRSQFFADTPMHGALACGPGLHSSAGWCPAPVGAGTTARIGLDALIEWHRAAARSG